MPSFVTITKIEDIYDRASVLFEDSTTEKTVRVTIALPVEDFQNEAALLDYIATFWPYDVFAKPPKKLPKDKHLEAKANAKQQKNITGRVTAGAP